MHRTTHDALIDQLDAQEEHFKDIFQALDHDHPHQGQDVHDALHEAPLEISTETSVTILLTTGGPHVELIGDLQSDDTIHNAQIVGYWGSEKIFRQVTPGTALHRAIQAYAESLTF